MIVNQGMGKSLRNQVFHVDDGMMLDRLVHERNYSDETAKVIDDEVEDLIKEAAKRAHEVLKVNMHKLEALKDALLEKETVEADEVLKILDGSHMPKAATLY
jgi:cell division protease FtsH